MTAQQASVTGRFDERRAVATARKPKAARELVLMRIELFIWALALTCLAKAAYAAGDVAGTSVPAVMNLAKHIATAAGITFGACAAAIAFQNASAQARLWRGMLSLFASPVFAIIALWKWPSVAGFGPGEWEFVIGFACSFFAWALVRIAQKYGPLAIESTADAAAEKAGIKPKPKRRRARAGTVEEQAEGVEP